MTEQNFDFFFEKAGRSGAQGAIAPAEQFFEGSIAEVSLAREIGQNSLDARSGDGAVFLRFELADMATADIPGIETLRNHLAFVAKETEGSEGHARMTTALETAHLETIPVLRISDYGTTGLRGSESKDENKSALSALTRGAGISANDGNRGGSFGIGSAVGPMSSALCTVLYTSLPDTSDEVVFAGYSRLASHRDATNEWRHAEGFYTDVSITDDFSYLRSPAAVGPFAPRTEPGTDIYVLGYRKAADDAALDNLRNAFLTHFLVAIHRGRLEVEGVSASNAWRLDSSTLEEYVKSSSDARAFYSAIQDPEPITRTSSRFGEMTLYVNVDDSLERSLHTMTMRAPLMKIDTFRHTSIPAKYAAILECADERGNQLLRSLEPPQHDRWDAGRAADGEKALKELKQFVREGLKSRVKAQLGDAVEIKGLAKYLPAPDLKISEDKFGQVPTSADDSSDEAATVHGRASESERTSVSPRKSVRVSVTTTTGADGDTDTKKGKDQGGGGRRRSSTPGLPGTGGEGAGNAQIRKGDVSFRSWSNSGSGSLTLALTATEDILGDMELVAIGVGGTAEDDYVLPITGVVVLDESEPAPVTWAANVLSGISLKAGKTTRLRVTLEHSHRYRLDIK